MDLLKIFQYRYLLQRLVLRDIVKKYRRSVLGILWSILKPLLMMGIIAMVFSSFFRFQIDNYPLYLLIGQILFSFFSESTNFSMTSILENSSLIKKVYIPKIMFPLSRVLSGCINLLFSIPALVIICLVTGQPLSIEMVSFILPLILFFFFVLGVGLILGTIVVFFRDIYHLYGILLTILSYMTPIFYPEEIVPMEYKGVLLFNPLYYYLYAFRQSLYNGRVPDLNLLIICTCISIVSMLLGVWLFKKYENQFILYI
ncbi:MAG: ABC transporter permease [Veillonella sp.]|jgi:ABC-2 type transporter|uniref:ABC transporter permease n=1 Tax=Veillonella sp. TaxID=1926307 RepID=UPI00257D1C96|nr:ABC transporter permease [Veillonella sp.]MBS5755705.1 ABC transporter permease [Veillonella sp.]